MTNNMMIDHLDNNKVLWGDDHVIDSIFLRDVDISQLTQDYALLETLKIDDPTQAAAFESLMALVMEIIEKNLDVYRG